MVELGAVRLLDQLDRRRTVPLERPESFAFPIRGTEMFRNGHQYLQLVGQIYNVMRFFWGLRAK